MQILGTSGEDGSGPWPYQPPQALTNLSVVPSALVVSVTFFSLKKNNCSGSLVSGPSQNRQISISSLLSSF